MWSGQSQRIDKHLKGGGMRTLDDIYSILEEISRKLDKPSPKQKKLQLPMEQVFYASPELETFIINSVKYLNYKLEKNYSPEGKNIREQLVKLYKDGVNFDNVKDVIDKKVKDWYSDVTMKMYLRPETLFSNKFHKYIEDAIAHKK